MASEQLALSPRRRGPSTQSNDGLLLICMPKQPCVYMLASGRNGTLYVGVTSDLFLRVGLHKQDLGG
jgi:hypothetical protein